MTSSKWSILSREAIKTLQANGRQASSYSAQFFLLLKFTQVDAPREGEMNYDEKCKSSVVYEFNRVQREEGRQTCSSTVAREWLHQLTQDQDHSPSSHDRLLRHLQVPEGAVFTTASNFNRLQQSGSVLETEVKAIERTSSSTKSQLAKLVISTRVQ